MEDVVLFIYTPQFLNTFAEFDKKVLKNLVKRCLIEPFATRITGEQHRRISHDILKRLRIGPATPITDNVLVGMVRCKEYELYRNDSSTLKRLASIIK